MIIVIFYKELGILKHVSITTICIHIWGFLYVPISNGYKQNPLYAFILGVENIVSISCPINGEYTGVLPDAPNFCAKMSSDCNNPNIMFYSVSTCSKTAGIYDGKNMSL